MVANVCIMRHKYHVWSVATKADITHATLVGLPFNKLFSRFTPSAFHYLNTVIFSVSFIVIRLISRCIYQHVNLAPILRQGHTIIRQKNSPQRNTF